MAILELDKVKPKEARKRARELVESVGLTESEFARFPHMLSGGQQQRVAIMHTQRSKAIKNVGRPDE